MSGPGKEVSMREAARFTLSELLLTIVIIMLLFSLAAAAAVDNKQNKITKGEQKDMTLEELKAQHPELVAQIEQEAVAADRARIQEIEEIQDTIGDAEMIAAAKFTKPTNAAALALEAMKKQAKLGGDFLKNRAQETAPANKVSAAEAPEIDPLKMPDKVDLEAEKAQMQELANKYAASLK